MNTNTATATKPALTIEHEGFTLPIITETTIGRKGAAGKSYYTLDFSELLATTTDGDKKVEDKATTGKNLLTFFRGFDSLMSFIAPDFNKAMVSLQVTTPANAKQPKVLTNDEKLAALRAYVSTIDEVTRQRNGKASELKRLNRELADLMKSFTPDKTAQLVALSTRIAEAQTALDADSE